jgi:hypothetical protein
MLIIEIQYFKGQKKMVKSTKSGHFLTKGCLTVQITSKFVADLKWLADFPERLKEYNELGKGYKQSI